MKPTISEFSFGQRPGDFNDEVSRETLRLLIARHDTWGAILLALYENGDIDGNQAVTRLSVRDLAQLTALVLIESKRK